MLGPDAVQRSAGARVSVRPRVHVPGVFSFPFEGVQRCEHHAAAAARVSAARDAGPAHTSTAADYSAVGGELVQAPASSAAWASAIKATTS